MAMVQALQLAFSFSALAIAVAAFILAKKAASRTAELQEMLSVPKDEAPPPSEPWRSQTL